MLFRQNRRAAAILAPATVIAAALGATAAATPASAKPYPPPSIHLLCTAAANGGTLEGSVCALPPGMTTAPNNYSATIAASKAGAAGAYGRLRADRGHPPARPDPGPLIRLKYRHHRQSHQGRDIHLHHQGDRRGPDRHAGLRGHRHGAGPPGPAAMRPGR